MKAWINGLHRYLGLLVFTQVLLWSIGGMLMAGLDFSDLYREPEPVPLVFSEAPLSPQDIQAKLALKYPDSQLLGVQMKSLGGALVYQLNHDQGPAILLDSQGEFLVVNHALATRIATQGYLGTGALKAIEKLPNSSGNYYSSSPIYRATFDDAQGTEIYIDPQTGKLLARRKASWALYNRMWEFHLMKYTPYSKLNKIVLLSFAVLNLLVALTGFVKFFRWGYHLNTEKTV